MSNVPQNCIFSDIQMDEQEISKKHFSELFHNIYNSVVFSTLPYTLYKENNSENCIYKYNSGNCIAFSHVVKNYLQANYNIKSYIIPASVPNSFRVLGTPHLTHCAILIPVSSHRFYIIDCALYFIEPIYCDLENNIQRTVKTSNAYERTIRNVNYVIDRCNSCLLDTNYKQQLNPNSLCVSCCFEDLKTEKWNYYLTEILNPDNNIGHSFLKHKKEPFILYTKVINKLPILKYKLKVQEDGTIVIKKYPEGDIVFNGNSGLFEESRFKKEMHRYLSPDFSI